MTDLDHLFDHYPLEVLERFKRYHRENPDVYIEFKQFAQQMRNAGRSRYSAEAIINAIRWHRDLKTTGDVFKINNDFKSIYARLLIYYHPEFADFFQLRCIRSKGIKSLEQRKRESPCKHGGHLVEDECQ